MSHACRHGFYRMRSFKGWSRAPRTCLAPDSAPSLITPALLFRRSEWFLGSVVLTAGADFFFCSLEFDHIPVWATDGLTIRISLSGLFVLSLLSVPHIRREKFDRNSFTFSFLLFQKFLNFVMCLRLKLSSHSLKPISLRNIFHNQTYYFTHFQFFIHPSTVSVVLSIVYLIFLDRNACLSKVKIFITMADSLLTKSSGNMILQVWCFSRKGQFRKETFRDYNSIFLLWTNLDDPQPRKQYAEHSDFSYFMNISDNCYPINAKWWTLPSVPGISDKAVF